MDLQWQHHVVESAQREVGSGLLERLDRLGTEGWQLVAVTDSHGRLRFWFRRPT